MDQSGRNKLFVQVYLNDIYKKLNEGHLSRRLLDELNRDDKNDDNPIFDFKTVLENIEDESAQNMFILMQFTKERNWTDYLATVLDKLGQKKLAGMLTEYNKSEPFRPYNDENALKVRDRIVTRSATSMCYSMVSKPRGLCLIILNETELETEAKAFEVVFRQLYFEVQLICNRTAEEIRQLFTDVANNQKYKQMDALVTVCIGHGQNENFLGHTYDEDDKDHIPIIDLVDIFTNTEQVPIKEKDKPRIHLFNCCRIKTDKCLEEINLEKYLNQNWTSNNAHTTIIYACTKGIESEYQYVKKKRIGWSFFGQAFICTLAQFAHEYSFDEILNKTNHRLKVEGNDRYLPQVVKQFCSLKLYFNPGFPKENLNQNE